MNILLFFSLDTLSHGGCSRIVKRKFAGNNSYARAVLVRKTPHVCIFAKRFIPTGEEIILSPTGDDGKVCIVFQLLLFNLPSIRL